jgi:hypothetical protein
MYCSIIGVFSTFLAAISQIIIVPIRMVAGPLGPRLHHCQVHSRQDLLPEEGVSGRQAGNGKHDGGRRREKGKYRGV